MTKRLLRRSCASWLILGFCTAVRAQQPDTADEAPVVLLPPFEVVESADWNYGTQGDLEVLSQASPETTQEFVDHYFRLKAGLAAILPENLRYRPTVPMAFLLFREETHSPAWDTLVASLKSRQAPAAKSAQEENTARRAIGQLHNFLMYDTDSEAVFVLTRENQAMAMRLSGDYVGLLLRNRTPSLPAWFVAGFKRLAARLPLDKETGDSPDAGFDEPTDGGHLSQSPTIGAKGAAWATNAMIADEGFDAGMAHAARKGKGKVPPVRIMRLGWLSKELSAKLLAAYKVGDRPQFERLLKEGSATPIPVAELFGTSRPEDPAWGEARFRDTAALFLRLMMSDWRAQASAWRKLMMRSYGTGLGADGALFPVDSLRDKHGLQPDAAKALWTFVDHAATEPVTEEYFRQCFGIGFKECDAMLWDSLYFNFNNALPIKASRPAASGTFSTHLASGEELARVKGRLTRLEIPYVERYCADLTSHYIEQARHTVALGGEDPQVMAERALVEVDAHSDATALPLLEKAAAAKVDRPRVYYELAWLRFAAIRQANPRDELSAEQREKVLTPLQAIQVRSPLLGAAYELEAESWRLSSDHPSPAQLQQMRGWLALFPRQIHLIEQVALLHAANGEPAEAREILARALAVVSDPAARSELETAQAAL